MKRRRILQLFLAGAAPAGLAAPAGTSFSIVTAHLPPLVMETGPRRGALREIVEEIARRMRATPRLAFRPWPRALMMSTTLTGTMVFPLTRTPARDPQYRWLAPLYEENYVFLAPRTSRFDIARPLDMKHMRIALIRGSAQGGMLRELGYQTFVEAKSVDEVHRFLENGMADAAFGERGIVANSLRAHKADATFLTSEPVRSSTAWLAGSLDFTEEDARRFQRVMQEITGDGTARRILAAYQLA